MQDVISQFVERRNGAIVVKNSDYVSIGVTRILSNYYKPSGKQIGMLENAHDKGKEKNFLSTWPSINEETYRKKCSNPSEVRHDGTKHDMQTMLDQLLVNNNIISITNEFPIGHIQLLVREEPTEKCRSKLMHATGAIDSIKYNTVTNKLLFVELKTGATKHPYMDMKTLYLKEKHVKQLTFYVMMFLHIAKIHNIQLNENDVELMIIAEDETKKTICSWKIVYDPTTFLGSSWQPQNWYGIIDNGNFGTVAPNSRSSPRQTERRIGNSTVNSQFACSYCGKPSMFEGKFGSIILYFCSTECKDNYCKRPERRRVRVKAKGKPKGRKNTNL